MFRFKKIKSKQFGDFRFALSSIVVLGLIFLLVSFWSRAPLGPKKVRVTNVADSSLAVSWLSDKPTKGRVILTSQPNRLLRPFQFFVCRYFSVNCLIFSDEIVDPSITHYVFLKGLQPKRAYYYRIVSGGRVWKYDWQGRVLPPLATTSVPENLSSPQPLYSYVYRADGETPIKNALVYLSFVNDKNSTVAGSRTLADFTNDKGVWMVDLGNLGVKADFLLVEVQTPDARQASEVVEFNQQREIKPIIMK